MVIYFKHYLCDTAPVTLFTVPNVKLTPPSPSHFPWKWTPVSISLKGPLASLGACLLLLPRFRQAPSLPTLMPSLPASSIPRVVSHLNEQLGSFISYKYWIRLIALIPLGVANWFYPRMYHFSCFLFFFVFQRERTSPSTSLSGVED